MPSEAENMITESEDDCSDSLTGWLLTAFATEATESCVVYWRIQVVKWLNFET